MNTTAYVIEMKVREDWARAARSDFTARDLEWHVVDYKGQPCRMAYLDMQEAIDDMPRSGDDWWECRVRDIQTNQVVALHPGSPIPPDWMSADRLRRPLAGLDTMSSDQLKALQREYYEASGRVRQMCAVVARELGTRLSAAYGPKYVYSPDDPDHGKFHGQRAGLSIYVDDYGGYMTVTIDGKRVCSTHATDQLFVPGEWVKRIDEIYPEAHARMQARATAAAERNRQYLIDHLSG